MSTQTRFKYTTQQQKKLFNADTLFTIVGKAIAKIKNIEIRDALYDSCYDSANSLTIIENFFKKLTSKKWSKTATKIFLRNWRSPGIGSASFCALTFRILQLCDQATIPEIKNTLFRAAMQIAEIAHQDVGIGGINHQKLYEQFAFKISGDDEWKLDKYHIPEIKNFFTKSRNYRQNGDDIGHAIALSLLEELYNYGEFTFISPLFIHWHKNILHSFSENSKNDLQFIFAHVGTTESDHFALAVSSLENYCKSLSIGLNASMLYQCNSSFINNMAA